MMHAIRNMATYLAALERALWLRLQAILLILMKLNDMRPIDFEADDNEICSHFIFAQSIAPPRHLCRYRRAFLSGK